MQMGASAQRPCSGSVHPHCGAGALVPVTPPPLPAVTPAVKLQYVDNIRWIREAAKHQLVRAPAGGRGVAVWALPQVKCCSPPEQLGESLLATLPRGHCTEKPGAFQKVAWTLRHRSGSGRSFLPSLPGRALKPGLLISQLCDLG